MRMHGIRRTRDRRCRLADRRLLGIAGGGCGTVATTGAAWCDWTMWKTRLPATPTATA